MQRIADFQKLGAHGLGRQVVYLGVALSRPAYEEGLDWRQRARAAFWAISFRRLGERF